MHHFILFLIILLAACSTALKYFDENNCPISKSEFEKKIKSFAYLNISGDSLTYKKLIARNQSGYINNRNLLLSYLKQKATILLDSSKPIVIIYHPGKDPCNSTAKTDKHWLIDWYTELEKGLDQIAGVQPIYLYKDPSGLEKYEGILNWIKDPDNIIESIFFKDQYPCGSFVVIAKSGEFRSYLGEYPKEYVWDATKFLQKQSKK